MGREVRGLDDRGTTTWSYQLENPVRQVEHADLDGDGREETLVATWPDDQPGVRMGQLPLSEFVAVTQAGRVVARIRPEELITSWRHQFAKRLVPEIRVLDLDGAGGTEVVLNCRHRAFFPDQLLVLWPSSGRWDWVLDHAGWIYDIERADSSGELIFLAVNNRLGMLPFVGRIGIEPPGSPARLQMSPGVMLLADDSLGRQSKAASWMLYVPLPQRLPGVRAGETNSVVLTPGGSVKVSIFGDAWQLDGHGNLTVGPNGGRDLREERLTLFDELSLLSAFRQPMGWAAIREAERRLQVRCRLVLQEPPYQAIAALAVAGAYARADRQQDAVQVLSAALQVVPYEDLAYRLASLLALSGRLAEAGEKALQLAEKPLTQRASYDAPMLILRLGIARHDEALVTRAIDLLRGRHATDTWQPRLAPSLWADARLWWDRARTSDSMVTSSPYAPDGDAVACLVRWRLGMTRQDDAAAMARLVDDSPDAAPAGRLALAAAQIATSRLPEALATLDRVILDLAPAARVDFASYQFQGLARAMEAKARLLSGEKAAAKALARALLPQFDRGLLPSVLCREVLAAE
ncbi:MAG: tetratricopeptide repeat protein [Thermoanaerobaculaceae bacterium]